MNITEEEFARYARGEASPEEKAKIERWLESPEDNLSPAPDEENRLKAIWQNLVAVEEEAQHRSLHWLKYLSGIAASLLLIGLGWWYMSPKEAKIKTVQTLNGQQLSLALPDGSLIRLKGGSTLLYPEHFNGARREVTLRGEAYFDVAQNQQKPFIVHTDSTLTEVLGTSFDLRSYADENRVSLTVEQGKVRFGRIEDQDGLVLTAGDQGVLEYGNKVEKGKTEIADVLAWKENSVIFDGISLAHAAKELEHHFGVRVIFKNKALQALTVTGRYQEASLDQIMRSLAFSAGIQYHYKAHILTIF